MASATVSGSSRRYADAAFGVAREAGDFEAWQAALDRVSALLDDPQAKMALASPAVPREQKRGLLDGLLPDAAPYVRNFLHILVERDRLEQVPEIAEAFRELVDRERGITVAEVTTAVPLDAESQRVVAQRLGAFLRRDPSRLRVRARVDPGILGGVLARVGDTLIDDSVRGRLQRLRQKLAAAT